MKMNKKNEFLFITSAIIGAAILYGCNRYQTKRPVVNYDQKVSIDNQIKTEKKISDLSKEYGLFFFFNGDCPYCDDFAPTVKRFAEKYNWDVIAVSISGEKHELFKRSESDRGLAEKWEIKEYPSLIAVNPKKELVTKISHGAISMEELEKRIAEIPE